MKIEVPDGTSIIRATVGQAVELVLPLPGGTGFRWEFSDHSGLDIERLADNPSGSFGGNGKEILSVTPRRTGSASVNFELRAPWLEKPSEHRMVNFEVL